MVKITCPDNNHKERTYIVDTLIQDFLGLDYELEFQDGGVGYSLTLDNGNVITIQDHFFSRFQESMVYLHEDNIPDSIEFFDDEVFDLHHLPVIYGSPFMEKVDGGGVNSMIDCGIDLFASSFFMLTRWEEYVSKNKDYLGRFTAAESLACRFGFLDRPVVNEYTDLIWKMLNISGINQERKQRKFKAYITHDVDFVLKWYSTSRFLRALAGDIIKRHSIKQFFRDIFDFIMCKLGKREDPFNTFDEIMEVSEKYGLDSYFFFMSVEPSKEKRHFSLQHPFVQHLISDIHDRGHRIGFHPDIGTYRDRARWIREWERLKEKSPQSVTFGRQHFLQFEVPETWQLWEEMNMEWDSSLCYSSAPGFRTGCCFSYHVFNFLSREQLSLIERPLIIMDISLVEYCGNGNPERMEKEAINLVDKVRFHRGDFVFLWHNNNFNTLEWRPYKHLYSNILEYISEHLG